MERFKALRLAFAKKNVDEAMFFLSSITPRELAYEMPSVVDNEPFVKFLLQAGAAINEPCGLFTAPIFFAVVRNAPNTRVLQLLVDYGADLSQVEVHGYNVLMDMMTPLYLNGCEHESILLMKKLNFLWRAGVNLEHRSADLSGLLDMAAYLENEVLKRYVVKMYEREKVVHFCGSKVFVLPDEFLRLLSGIF